MLKKHIVVVIICLLFFAGKGFVVFAQGDSVKLGTFTLSPTVMPSPTIVSGSGSPFPFITPIITPTITPKASAPAFNCIDSYTPRGGNNIRSRSRVYGMLLNRYPYSMPIDKKFSLADEDVILMAVINNHVFGRLPDTDDRRLISQMLGQFKESYLNYFYMKGFLRSFGILGASFTEIEDALLAMDCEERVAFIRPKSSSPIRVFVSEKTDMRINVKNTIKNDYPYSSKNTWEFTANPDGRLQFANGLVYTEIKFEYKPLIDYRPNTGIVISSNNLRGKLSYLIDRLNLSFMKKDILKFIMPRVPKSPYYILSVLPKNKADEVLQWEIYPAAENELKYIFYIKPLIEPFEINKLSQNSLSKMSFKNSRITVIDYSVLIDY